MHFRWKRVLFTRHSTVWSIGAGSSRPGALLRTIERPDTTRLPGKAGNSLGSSLPAGANFRTPSRRSCKQYSVGLTVFNLEAAFGTLRPVSRRLEIEREIDYELQFHMELLAEENIEAGLAPEEARQAALIRFGDLKRLSEVCRETRITGAGAWRHDIAWAFRMLGKRPWLTVLAALTLSLGCGALITI